VVHNGLSEQELTPVCEPPAERPHDFVFVGELRALKGVDTLLDAVRMIRAERAVSVLIAGAGPDADRFRARARDLGLDDAVTFSPPIHPATRAFGLGRCLVVPSWAESLPYIVLEAGGAAMPMLTTRVGGIPEIYGPYRERLLPARDADRLATAMRQTMDEPSAAQELADAIQRRIATEFRIDSMVWEIDQLYASLRLPTSAVEAS
jgi:glycosyltransferase involved in cell wall biosynthesis